MAASSRGEMVGARGELLGARGGFGPDLHCSQGKLWLLEVLGARGGCGTYGPLGVQITKLYYLTKQMKNAGSLTFLN